MGYGLPVTGYGLGGDVDVEAFGEEGGGDGFHLFTGDLFEVLLRRLAVDDIDHDLFRPHPVNSPVPRVEFVGRGVVDNHSVMFSPEKTGLEREVPVERFEPSDELLDGELCVHGAVDAAHHLIRAGVEFEDSVVA